MAQRNPVPVGSEQAAVIPGIPHARYMGEPDEAQIRELLTRNLAQQRDAGKDDSEATSMLALSGGGANGAFGAGLLVGWTAEGSRPEFSVVSGISTGALIAPFAFLGSAYDPVLERLYTRTDTSGIITKRSFLSSIGSDALSDSTPLRAQVAAVIDADVLELIAAEHRRGRRLLVGTTNLDAGRGVLWDMGEIAASGQPAALQLFRDILVASASIPVAFPPVYIDVAVDGVTYRELHVDGGIAAQVFIYPAWLQLGEMSREANMARERKAYVIRNSMLRAKSTVVEPKMGAIASRSMDMLIKQQGLGDLVRIYSTAQRDGLEFNLAYIPDDVENTSAEVFDPVYMQALFTRGYQMAEGGYPWRHDILGLDQPEQDSRGDDDER